MWMSRIAFQKGMLALSLVGVLSISGVAKAQDEGEAQEGGVWDVGTVFILQKR